MTLLGERRHCQQQQRSASSSGGTGGGQKAAAARQPSVNPWAEKKKPHVAASTEEFAQLSLGSSPAPAPTTEQQQQALQESQDREAQPVGYCTETDNLLPLL